MQFELLDWMSQEVSLPPEQDYSVSHTSSQNGSENTWIGVLKKNLHRIFFMVLKEKSAQPSGIQCSIQMLPIIGCLPGKLKPANELLFSTFYSSFFLILEEKMYYIFCIIVHIYSNILMLKPREHCYERRFLRALKIL